MANIKFPLKKLLEDNFKLVEETEVEAYYEPTVTVTANMGPMRYPELVHDICHNKTDDTWSMSGWDADRESESIPKNGNMRFWNISIG